MYGRCLKLGLKCRISDEKADHLRAALGLLVSLAGILSLILIIILKVEEN